MNKNIIIISPLQSTAGHRPLQRLAISLDPRLLASSSCQPSCTNRHSTLPEGVLHYVYLDVVSSPEQTSSQAADKTNEKKTCRQKISFLCRQARV
jgi:hypothetical protein